MRADSAHRTGARLRASSRSSRSSRRSRSPPTAHDPPRRRVVGTLRQRSPSRASSPGADTNSDMAVTVPRQRQSLDAVQASRSDACGSRARPAPRSRPDNDHSSRRPRVRPGSPAFPHAAHHRRNSPSAWCLRSHRRSRVSPTVRSPGLGHPPERPLMPRSWARHKARTGACRLRLPTGSDAGAR